MPGRLSAFLNVRPSALKGYGVFDALIGFDSKLFVDPILLKRLRIPELRDSRKHFESYFREVLILLANSKKPNDVAWEGARRRLVFRETSGTALGYGRVLGDGTGIGPELGGRLLRRAAEIVAMGISDPAIFELLALFEEGFGPDRLSDMTLRIVRDDLLRYTARVARDIGVRDLIRVRTHEGTYKVPKGPNAKQPLTFIPSITLRPLPVAQSWDEIGDVVWFNEKLRRGVNHIIAKYWKEGRKVLKQNMRASFFANPESLRVLLQGYKQYNAKPYDLRSDPQGLLSWFELGSDYANDHPLTLTLSKSPGLDEIESVVEKIIQQFKEHIEDNGLNIHLYDPSGKPLHERYSQRLFFAIADVYCKANNIDLSPEPNAGSGPVDFRFSHGYHLRLAAEIKLSSNTQLVHGYQTQLPTYEKSEKAKRSAYVVIRVTESTSGIRKVKRLNKAALRAGKKAPRLFIIDGRRKRSASKR
jgi:hypothetical protein